MKDTGPVKPNQMISMTKWENVWYNNTITRLELLELEVTFMDGTVVKFDKTQTMEMFINRSY